MSSTTFTMRHGDFREVLPDVKAALFVTSPPYNIGSSGPRNDKGRNSGGGYAVKSFRAITDYPDSLPEAAYQDQQAAALTWMADHLMPGGTIVYNHKPRQRDKAVIDPHEWLLRPDVRERLTEATYPVVWNRGSTHNNGRGQLWQTTERLYILRATEDTAWRMDNYRYRGLEAAFQKDAWHIPLETRPAGGHNAPFPVRLAEAAIRMWSNPGDLICDPYGGSGTTGVAALTLGRRFAGAERQLSYYQLAYGRLAAAREVTSA